MRAMPVYSSSSSLITSLLAAALLWTTMWCVPAWAQASGPAAGAAPRPLITQAVDESQLTTLKGNVHPLARPEFDLGTAPPSLPMERVVLVLKRSPEQEFALRKLLDDQQDKASANYHKWLTPVDFGKQFGPTDSDIQTITLWLQSHGFQVGTTKGRTVLEFSGTAGQVQEAFHTTIHKYLVNGEQHWANANDPQIPTGLTPAVAGVLTLHNFLKKPQYRVDTEKGIITPGKPPQVTFGDGSHGLGPGDYAVIYNINPVYSMPITGSGVTIGVVARTEIAISDFTEFQSLFNFSSNVPNIIVNGTDPGDVPGDDFEGTLDATWSQSVAPGATVDFVVSASTDTTDGVDLSEVYIVENNLANVMTESYGSCEAGATDGLVSFVAGMSEQAAAQGISYMVSTGDNGAEGCDNPNREAVATGPISVNVLASSPFIVGVGGTVFNENGQDAKYWNSNNSASGVSALSYIPEDVWNDSCPSSSCGANANIWAASGGASLGNTASGGTFAGYPKPSWQAGVTGIPANNSRYLPDVSLTAAIHDGYVLCFQGSCAGGLVYRVGGTSASAPSFAGIMALVDQRMGQVETGGSRQGQADYVLYPLAAAGNGNLSKCNGSSTTTLPATTCIFNDVTVGNNEVPGEPGYPSAPYTTNAGYDPASGLGSVNVANLVTKWASAIFRPTNTTLMLSPTTNITHGQSVNVTISVVPSSGTGTPTGDVSLIATVGGSNGGSSGVDGFTLTSSGTFSGTTSQLPGGASYQVTAHYAGNSTSTATGVFAPSDSTPVTVSVTAENSTTTLAASTFDANGNFVALTGGSIPYGDLVYLDAAVAGTSGVGVPTGTVTFNDTNPAGIPGNPYPLNSEGSTTTPVGLFNVSGGVHSVTASYNHDPSFNASSSSALGFTITPATTSVALSANPTSVASGGSVTLTATMTLGTAILPSFGNAPTGTVSFYNGSTLLGSGTVSGSAGSGNLLTGNYTLATGTASLVTTALPAGTDNITAVYNGDGNYAVSPASPAVQVTVSAPTFTLNVSPVTVSQGGSQAVTITVSAVGNFTGAVSNFACSGLPAETTCTAANPSTVTGSGSTSVTIQTTGLGMRRHAANETRRTGWIATVLLSLVGICVFGVPLRRHSRATMVSLMILTLVLLPGCGGGGGGNSTPPNPVPTIASLAPNQQAAGSQSQTVTINGSNFLASSTATYNGTAHAITYVSGSQISIALTSADMASQGTDAVVVTNPAPGGGASNSVPFNVVSGTPVGTFNVTVSASSASTGTVQTQFQLTVQ